MGFQTSWIGGLRTMKPDILTKLAAELQVPITSERQVVYIMVELRKLMELNGDGTKYTALKFHCDWVAHPWLKGPQAQEIVKLFDRYQELEDNTAVKQGQPDMSFMGRLGPALAMTNFRNELNAYLHSQGLDPSTPDDDGKWAAFLKHYAGVIEDCPLQCVGQNLRFVDKVSLRVLDVLPTRAVTGGFQLAIEWSWRSKLTGKEYTNQQLY
jgi:hypothetical protein